MKLNYPQYENGMFKLYKKDFDDIALMVLKEFLPRSVNEPQAIDINYIIRDCLFLNLMSKNIVADKGILGLIAFESISISCLDLAFNPSRIDLQAGDIVIDLSLSGNRMRFRRRFTLAHEAAHWILHRTYHSPIMQPFEFRKPYEESMASNVEKKIHSIFTDADREEWQANSLAAAMLMPKGAFISAASTSNFCKFDVDGKIRLDDSDEYNNLLDYLSSTFEVSRQAIEIRLEQLDIV